MRASEKHLIVACEDIVDARGFKLWAKGQPVSASLQQKLLERRLERPLETCLSAQDGATLPFLQESMASFLSSPSALAQGLAPWAGPVQEHMQGLTWHSVVQLLCTTAMATRTSYIAHADEAVEEDLDAVAMERNVEIGRKLAARDRIEIGRAHV